jgi:Na+-transporting NADH:ubiquinone oxidoreductase subunit NqrC
MADDQPKKRISRTKISIIALSLFCIASVGGGIFFYLQYTQAQAKINEKDDTLKRIATLVEMPNESPSIMTVADKSKLQNQQLASKLNDGDILLVFSQNRRIFIYRPGTNKIVDMLSFGAEEAQTIKP